jgi:hypothetical protein
MENDDLCVLIISKMIEKLDDVLFEQGDLFNTEDNPDGV